MLPLRRLLVHLLAGVGALTLLIVLLVWLSAMLISDHDRSEFNLKSELNSPDQVFRAAHYVGMGGGAAGWCEEVETVNRRASLSLQGTHATRDGANEDGPADQVFTVGWGSQLEMEMEWLPVGGEDLPHLHISFSLTDKTGGVSSYLRPQNSEGSVRVIYTVNP